MSQLIYRVVSACGALGYGFPKESMEQAIQGRVDAIVSDAGSMDAGPYFLGTGTQYFEREAVKADYTHMVRAGLATGVTTSDLTSSGDEAAGRAAFVLLKQTYRKLFRKNAIDSDDDEPPRLSFDFSVFGTDPSRRGVSAIYELNPKWRIIGKVGETGTFRGMLHYLIRFR